MTSSENSVSGPREYRGPLPLRGPMKPRKMLKLRINRLPKGFITKPPNPNPHFLVDTYFQLTLSGNGAQLGSVRRVVAAIAESADCCLPGWKDNDEAEEEKTRVTMKP